MNILVLRVSAIGDVIHTLPAIFLIKKSIPNAKISWVVQKKASNVLREQNFINKLFILPDKFLAIKNLKETTSVVKKIRNNKWDLIIDFQGILKTSIISLFIPGKKIGFDKDHARLGLTSYFTNKQVRPIYTNIIQKNLSLASGAISIFQKNEFKTCPTINFMKKLFHLNINKNSQNKVLDWLKINKIKKFIILSPSTTWESKHWPKENWLNLIKKLNQKTSNEYSIILLGKDYGEQAKNIYEKLKNNNQEIIASPKWDLLKTSFLISLSELLVAPDTGILHLADFLQKKSIGIFGPTKAKKHGPFIFKENIKNAIQIECPHFYKKTHSDSKNARNNINCMYKLTPEKLLNKIIKLLY